MTKINVDIDTLLSTEQAIDRYYLLAKKAKETDDFALNEFVSEAAEIVESLQTGRPVEVRELKYFLEDITNHWEGKI